MNARTKKQKARKEERLKREINPRHTDILELRYGLNNCKPHTLEKTGEIKNLSKERIRQIVIKAERHLKHASKKNHPLRNQMEIIWGGGNND